MIWIVLATGFLTIVICLAILVAPKLLRQIIDCFSIGSRLYIGGLIRIIVGVLLLFLASGARFWLYVVIIGLMATTAGVSLFFFPLRRTKKLLTRLQHQSNLSLRLLAIIGLAVWGLLAYSLLPVIAASFLR